MAIFPWYGGLTLGKLYGNANVFLQTDSYSNLKRWTEVISAREAVKKALDMKLTALNESVD